MATKAGLNNFTCSNKRSLFDLQLSPITLKVLLFDKTSRVWIPIDPVDPNTKIFFFILRV
jgi:hypothetical protein